MKERLNLMQQTPDNVMNNRSPDTLKSLDALEKFTLPIIDYFTKALNHEDKWVRYLAAEALGCIGDARAVEPLHQLRVDKDADLRFVSCQSLKNIRNMQEILTDSRKRGCDTCLIRYIAEEVLVQRNPPTSPQRTENCR
jgi:HEAT repeat protein